MAQMTLRLLRSIALNRGMVAARLSFSGSDA
jgi:hypothetical protein